jgi:hypothetical protein
MKPLLLALSFVSTVAVAHDVKPTPSEPHPAPVPVSDKHHSCFRGNFNGDKVLHVVGVGAVDVATTVVTGDERFGIAAGAAVSIARELYKYNHEGFRCSYISMGSDILGLVAGHYLMKNWKAGVSKDDVGRPKFMLLWEKPL